MYAEYGDFAGSLGEGIGAGLVAFIAAYSVVLWIVGILMLVSTCFLMKKAGEHWWAALIPVYNYIVLLRMADKKWWWILLLLIPVVNIVLSIVWMVDLLRNFGKPGSHVLLLLFFGVIYWPVLAFSSGTVFKGGQNKEEAAA
jgi:lysylphosphatidylglycerol synthetase-like protein (DUF2156 family)